MKTNSKILIPKFFLLIILLFLSDTIYGADNSGEFISPGGPKKEKLKILKIKIYTVLGERQACYYFNEKEIKTIFKNLNLSYKEGSLYFDGSCLTYF